MRVFLIKNGFVYVYLPLNVCVCTLACVRTRACDSERGEINRDREERGRERGGGDWAWTIMGF